jgi:autotransporter-associated beta strand protein
LNPPKPEPPFKLKSIHETHVHAIPQLHRQAAIIAATFSLANHSQAGNGTWNVDADGFWNEPSNWDPTVVPGTTAGDVVNLTFDITTNKTVTIDTAVRLGTLNIGDPDGSQYLHTGAQLRISHFRQQHHPPRSSTRRSETPPPPSARPRLSTATSPSATAPGDLNLTGVISNGTNGAKAISISSPGTGNIILSGANTFGGGLIIQRGLVSGATSTQAFGTAGITLGDTSGSADATLKGSQNLNFANPIVVQSGSSGNTLTILGWGGASTSTFSGGVTLNRDLTLDSLGGTLAITTNAITGSSTLSITNSAATPNLETTGWHSMFQSKLHRRHRYSQRRHPARWQCDRS